MKIKVSLNSAGIANVTAANADRWKKITYRYNRIHMPIEGKALYHDTKSDKILSSGGAYLLVNSSANNLETIPDSRYYHMYIDFRTIPPLLNRETLEIDLADDYYYHCLLKAVQSLIQENILNNHRFSIYENRDKEMFRQVEGILQVMLMHLHSRYGINAVESPKIESAIRYIESNYAKQISNKDIADELHIDTRYLIRLFTKYMDMPPYQYLTQCRIEHSVEALRNGKTVTETAFLCGYQSENAFRIAFKRVMGCSPKAFLKQ